MAAGHSCYMGSGQLRKTSHLCLLTAKMHVKCFSTEDALDLSLSFSRVVTLSILPSKY